MEHLVALDAEGLDALVRVAELLVGDAVVRRVPPLTVHALTGADFLLLVKPGEPDVDGLPRLHPICMPEAFRKLRLR